MKRLPSRTVNPDVSPAEYVAALRHDVDRLAACAESGPLDAPIAACPDWDLRKLLTHTGGVHRWATQAILHSAPPTSLDGPKPAPDASGTWLGAWLGDGVDALATAIESTQPDDDTWHPFPAEQKAWVWARRQAMETMIHRWDAEIATTGESSLDPTLATAGLGEFFEMLLPRVLLRDEATVPDVSLHLHCTNDDVPGGAGEWIVWGEDGEYRMEAVHRHGDAALRGTSSDLLLVMMGRADVSTVDLRGDQGAVDAWFALPGL